jgi:transposase
MQAITTMGLDIARSVFQVHGVDAQGNVVISRQLNRPYVPAFFEKLSRQTMTAYTLFPALHIQKSRPSSRMNFAKTILCTSSAPSTSRAAGGRPTIDKCYTL